MSSLIKVARSRRGSGDGGVDGVGNLAMETGHPSTRAVNSGSGNRALRLLDLT